MILSLLIHRTRTGVRLCVTFKWAIICSKLWQNTPSRARPVRSRYACAFLLCEGRMMQSWPSLYLQLLLLSMLQLIVSVIPCHCALIYQSPKSQNSFRLMRRYWGLHVCVWLWRTQACQACMQSTWALSSAWRLGYRRWRCRPLTACCDVHLRSAGPTWCRPCDTDLNHFLGAILCICTVLPESGRRIVGQSLRAHPWSPHTIEWSCASILLAPESPGCGHPPCIVRQYCAACLHAHS